MKTASIFPTAGTSSVKCPICSKPAKIQMDFNEVSQVRGMGKTSKEITCDSGHKFSVSFKYPMVIK